MDGGVKWNATGVIDEEEMGFAQIATMRRQECGRGIGGTVNAP